MDQGNLYAGLTQTYNFIPAVQDLYNQAQEYIGSIGPGNMAAVGPYLEAVATPEGETASTPEGKALMSLVHQLVQQAQPVQPLQVGPFSVTPQGRMSMQQQEMQALSTPAQFLYNLMQEQRQRDLERQQAAAQLATQLGISADQLMASKYLSSADLASDIIKQALSMQTQSGVAAGNQAASILGDLIRSGTIESIAGPEWTRVAGALPGLVQAIGSLGNVPGLAPINEALGTAVGAVTEPISKGVTGLVDWIGGLF